MTILPEGWEMVSFSIYFENGVDRLVGVWEREKSKMTPGFSAQGIRSMVVPFSEMGRITETGVWGGEESSFVYLKCETLVRYPS